MNRVKEKFTLHSNCSKRQKHMYTNMPSIKYKILLSIIAGTKITSNQEDVVDDVLSSLAFYFTLPRRQKNWIANGIFVCELM